jgi:soluble lytic murein transglycosylase-like protein
MYHIHPAILAAAEAHGKQFYIAPELILAVCMQESNLDPWAVGDGGHSIGLMQLHDQGAGAGMSIAERNDPWTNIEHGTQYLANCYQASKTWPDALSAYNQGVGGWQKNGRGVNQAYVDAVLAFRDSLQRKGYDGNFSRYLWS